jgi:flagellar protein FliO/FliZ
MFYGIDPVRYVIAFIAIIAIMAGAFYLLRRFGAGALASGSVRGRQPRLAVIDTASVDTRRSLVLIRRDNVEHLIMIGGPTDVVIEPNIVRATAAASAREAAPPRAADMLPRAVPLAESGMWPAQSEPIPRARAAAPLAPPPAPQPDEADAAWSVHPEAAPRTVPDSGPREREPRLALERELRVATEREPRIGRDREARATPERELRITPPEPELRIGPEREPRAAPAAARPTVDAATRGQNSERLAGLAADLSRSYIEPALTSESAAAATPPPPPPARGAEPRRPPAVPASPVSGSDDQNLAEMAQQLESVLQRPRPAAAPAIALPAPRADAPPAPPRAEVKPAIKLEAKVESKQESKVESKPESKPAAKAAVKPAFDNLEQEMASLLGRPSGKG